MKAFIFKDSLEGKEIAPTLVISFKELDSLLGGIGV